MLKLTDLATIAALGVTLCALGAGAVAVANAAFAPIGHALTLAQ